MIDFNITKKYNLDIVKNNSVNMKENRKIINIIRTNGEMGPFGSEKDPDGSSRYKTSWYGGYSTFVRQTLDAVEHGVMVVMDVLSLLQIVQERH